MKTTQLKTEMPKTRFGALRPSPLAIRHLKFLLLALLALCGNLVQANPLGTAFTYQGRLTDGGAPATGSYDFWFKAYDAASGGTQQGNTVTVNALPVTNGLFTVTLDFGAGVFAGAERWLEIYVHTNDAAAPWVFLTPRQPLTPSPYALYAPNAGAAASVPAAGLTGMIADAQLSANVALLNGSPQFTTAVIAPSFSGNGSGLTNLNSASLTGPLTVAFAPRDVGHTNQDDLAMNLVVAGTNAFLSTWVGGIHIYGVANPSAPAGLGNISSIYASTALAVAGHYLYVGFDRDAFRVYDISNPASPVQLGFTTNGFGFGDGNATALTVAGNYAYLGNGIGGLWVYDVSVPALPACVARRTNDLYNEAIGVAVAGSHLYLANGALGLMVYDITTPANPAAIGEVTTYGNAQDVVVAGNYAYVANWFNGLQVCDVSDPAHPVLVWEQGAGSAQGIALAGNYALLACGPDGLAIYDISNPLQPRKAAQLVESGSPSAQKVTAANGYVYLANGNDGLRIYQLANVIAGAPGSVFQGDGSGLANVNVQAFNVVGRVSAATLPANVAYVDANQTFSGSNVFSGGQTIFSGKVGIGTNAPAAALDVRAQNQNALWGETTGDWNAGVVGKNNSAYNHTLGVLGESVNGRGVYGTSENLGVMGYTHYGIAVYGLVESANGCAGQFRISFDDSTNAAVVASTSGVGPALRAEAASAGGIALELKTGGVRVPGAGVGTGTPAFIHLATTNNISANITILDNPLCNGDAGAILIVTHNFSADSASNRYEQKPVGVWYNGARWTIFHEDNSAMSPGRAFNVLVIKP